MARIPGTPITQRPELSPEEINLQSSYDWRTLEEGSAAVKYALEQYATAQKTGIWDYGYGSLQTLQIPPYAFKFSAN